MEVTSSYYGWYERTFSDITLFVQEFCDFIHRVQNLVESERADIFIVGNIIISKQIQRGLFTDVLKDLNVSLHF